METRGGARGVWGARGSGGTAGTCRAAAAGCGGVRHGICGSDAAEKRRRKTRKSSGRRASIFETPWKRFILAARKTQEKAERRAQQSRNAPDTGGEETGRSSRQCNRRLPGGGEAVARLALAVQASCRAVEDSRQTVRPGKRPKAESPRG